LICLPAKNSSTGSARAAAEKKAQSAAAHRAVAQYLRRASE